MAGAPLPEHEDVVRTGIVRHIDDLGRIVIPIEVRKRLGLAVKDAVEVFVRGETILLAKTSPNCVFCGAAEGLSEHRGRTVCRSCVDELAAARPPAPR